MQLLEQNTGNFLSQIKDPFNQKNIRKIDIEIKRCYGFNKDEAADDGFIYKATVWFKNGNTTGNQDFYGNGLEDLLKQVQSEIMNL